MCLVVSSASVAIRLVNTVVPHEQLYDEVQEWRDQFEEQSHRVKVRLLSRGGG